MNLHKFAIIILINLFLLACSTQQGFRKIFDLGGRYTITYLEGHSEYPDKYKILVNNETLYVSHNTSLPAYQSLFLLENTLINPGESVLDLGTGCGIQAIFAARNAAKVVATDINSYAASDTEFNAKINNLQNVIDTRVGDLFSVLDDHEKFDVIIANLNYPYINAPDEQWILHVRFFTEVARYLRPNGRIYYESGWFENMAIIAQMASQNDLIFTNYAYFSDMPYGTPPIVYTITHRETLLDDTQYRALQPTRHGKT